MPVWHVSIAVLILKRPMRCARWNELERIFAEREAVALLEGVGRVNDDDFEFGETALHLRRRINDREMKIIGPAVDIREK